MSSVDAVLSEIMTARIKKALMEEAFFCWPARVVEITGVNKVNVEILLSKRYVGGESARYPILTDVPVESESSDAGRAFVRLPLKEGDSGSVAVFDRAIYSWLNSSGDVVAPDKARSHSLSDVKFRPGLWPFSNTEAGAFDNSLVVQNNLTSININPTGQIAISGATEELIGLLVEIVADLVASTVTVPSTPATVPLNNAATLAAKLVRLITLKQVI